MLIFQKGLRVHFHLIRYSEKMFHNQHFLSSYVLFLFGLIKRGKKFLSARPVDILHNFLNFKYAFMMLNISKFSIYDKNVETF